MLSQNGEFMNRKLIKLISTFIIIVSATANLLQAENVNSKQDSNPKILILGAAGQIGKMLTQALLKQTDATLILYGRNVTQRLTITDATRENLVDGDFRDKDTLLQAMKHVDIVYLNDMGGDSSATKTIIQAMQASGVKRLIAVTAAGIYDEIPGAFGEWNKKMVNSSRTKRHIESANAIESAPLDYTILRLTWLYNQAGNTQYTLTFKGEPFVGAQVTRQAVTQLILDIINDTSGRFLRTNVGVSEPNTDWAKPSFY